MYGMSDIEAGCIMYKTVCEIRQKYPNYHPPSTYQQYQQQLQQHQQQLEQIQQQFQPFVLSDIVSLCISYLDDDMMKKIITKMTSLGYDVNEQSHQLLHQHLMWSYPEIKADYEAARHDALNAYDQAISEVYELYPNGYHNNQLNEICQHILMRCDEYWKSKPGDTTLKDYLWDMLIEFLADGHIDATIDVGDDADVDVDADDHYNDEMDDY